MVHLTSRVATSLERNTASRNRRQVRGVKKIWDREYSRLRALVPDVAAKQEASKVQVLEAAVKYIEQLHSSLLQRLRLEHGSGAEDKAQETVRVFVSRMMPQSNNTSGSGIPLQSGIQSHSSVPLQPGIQSHSSVPSHSSVQSHSSVPSHSSLPSHSNLPSHSSVSFQAGARSFLQPLCPRQTNVARHGSPLPGLVKTRQVD